MSTAILSDKKSFGATCILYHCETYPDCKYYIHVHLFLWDTFMFTSFYEILDDDHISITFIEVQTILSWLTTFGSEDWFLYQRDGTNVTNLVTPYNDRLLFWRTHFNYIQEWSLLVWFISRKNTGIEWLFHDLEWQLMVSRTDYVHYLVAEN